MTEKLINELLHALHPLQSRTRGTARVAALYCFTIFCVNTSSPTFTRQK
jgi:hypothetical protein